MSTLRITKKLKTLLITTSQGIQQNKSYKSNHVHVHAIVCCWTRRRCHIGNSSKNNNDYSNRSNTYNNIYRMSRNKRIKKKRSNNCSKASVTNAFCRPIVFSLTYSCNMTPWQDTWIPTWCNRSTWQYTHCSLSKSTWQCNWRVSEVHRVQVLFTRTLPCCPTRILIKYTTTRMMTKLLTYTVM